MVIPANYQADLDRVVGGNDVDLGERVFLAYLDGGVSDPDRTNEEIDAILRVGTERTSAPQGGAGISWQTKLAGGEAELHISRSAYPNAILKTGDKVRALARVGQPWFEVATVNTRAQPRIIVRLNEAK